MSAFKHIKKWFYFLLKTALVLGAIVLVILTIMTNMGGSGDTLKESIEGFIKDNTGHVAKIHRFNRMTFYPRISVDFEDLDLYRPSDALTQDAVVSVDRMRASLDFWDVFLGTGKVQFFELEKLFALPGVLLDKPVAVEKLGIVDSGDRPPYLGGNGFLGQDPFSITLGMEIEGQGKSRKYAFPKIRPLEIKLGSITIKGSLHDEGDTELTVDHFSVMHESQPVMRGVLKLRRSESSGLDVSGNLVLAERWSVVTPQLHLSLKETEPFVTGTLGSSSLTLEDIGPGSRFEKITTVLVEIFADPDIEKTVRGLSYTDPNISISFKNIYKNGKNLGAYSGFLPIKGGMPDTKALADQAVTLSSP